MREYCLQALRAAVEASDLSRCTYTGNAAIARAIPGAGTVRVQAINECVAVIVRPVEAQFCRWSAAGIGGIDEGVAVVVQPVAAGGGVEEFNGSLLILDALNSGIIGNAGKGSVRTDTGEPRGACIPHGIGAALIGTVDETVTVVILAI